MDQIVKHFDSIKDDDLRIVPHRGIAYQRDMTKKVSYDEDYFNKCAGYEDQEIALQINAGRVQIVQDHYGSGPVLDVGIGSGEFIKKRGSNTCGIDVNPTAIKWLRKNDCYSDQWDDFGAYTFWDVLEHIEDPRQYFKQMRGGSYLFTSIPIFKDLRKIRESKHYRPGEHLYYFTKDGFVGYMEMHGFRLLDERTFEIDAGREDIHTFAFIKDLPSYSDNVGQYKDIYANIYGNSSFVYFDFVAEIIKKRNPRSVLDYGCGWSDLVCYFWNDGKRIVERFDPAIPRFKNFPQRQFDLILCTDVMEHIGIGDLDRTLTEMASLGNNVLFVISTVPAKTILPDGRNAHVTLLTESEWMGWIKDYFGSVYRIPDKCEKGLLVCSTFEVPR